ncbi:MAG: hypothetical protein B7X48_13605 [Acidiphilium sp. 34-60-192]|nr:MAG: hypothetical protein B7X48_13605 [Acidiphilium sp. 34-60-192]
MAHVPRTHDQACPAPDQFNLRVELLPLDDLAASMLLAGGPQMADGFVVRRDHGGDDAHVSVLITTDASLAERTKNALQSSRRLVITVLLADKAPAEFSCPYILCTPHTGNLASLLVELRRLFLEPSLIGIDFTDYAPLFQHPGQIHFAQQILSTVRISAPPMRAIRIFCFALIRSPPPFWNLSRMSASITSWLLHIGRIAPTNAP